MASTESVVSDVEKFIIRRIRKEHPFMEITFVRDLARTLANTLQDGIQRGLPQAEESRNRFNFFTLPAEVRNRIYELVIIRRYESLSYELQKEINIDITGVPNYDEDEEYEDMIEARRLAAEQPSITKVCHQMREETLPIFYGLNVFESSTECILRYHRWNLLKSRPALGSGRDHYHDLGADRWFQCIGKKNAGLIKHFTLAYSSMTEDDSVPASDIAVVQAHFEGLGIELPKATEHSISCHRMLMKVSGLLPASNT